jgi:hypothetical protein
VRQQAWYADERSRIACQCGIACEPGFEKRWRSQWHTFSTGCELLYQAANCCVELTDGATLRGFQVSGCVILAPRQILLTL